ncbi:DRAM2 [Mytilus coruscus]|uniref:DRAM2 n=1 Tax=Mytilus coruscus TaxID=42192 RepID=A0A6J8CYP7_MYTCO|nr:DRAM2 [Mytilus coruscus]
MVTLVPYIIGGVKDRPTGINCLLDLSMCFRGLSYLPILLVLTSFATFIVSYIIAIVRHDVSPYFPYISDTGTKPPESCIFGQFLNISAALAIATMYVRYKLVSQISVGEDTKLACLNKAGLVLGILSALGLSMVANFQETNVEPVHVTGAALVLGVGVIYAFVQTSLSYRMNPDYNGLKICRIRLAISCIALTAMIITFVSATVSRIQVHGHIDKTKWKPEDGGFTAHIISTISEWVTAVTFLLFFFTFVRDFQKVKLGIVATVLVRHLDVEPVEDISEHVDERRPLLS